MDPLQRAAELFYQALTAQQAGRLQAAERLYREALELAPRRVSVLLNLSVVLIYQRRFADALVLCERVLALEPGEPDALQNAALCRKHLHGEDDPDALQRVVAARPGDAQAWNNLGLVLGESGRREEARAALDRALELDPSLQGARANWASLRVEARDAAPERAAPVNAPPSREQAAVLAALAANPDAEAAQRAFHALCAAPGFMPAPDDAVFRAHLLAALTAPWGRPQALAPLCLRLLRLDPAIEAQVRGAEPRPAAWSAASRQLLLALLPRALLGETEFEDWWSRLRGSLLGALEGPVAAADETLDLLAALAAQAFLCGYLPAPAEAVLERHRALLARMAQALAAGVDVAPAWIAASASIAPLASLGLDDQLLARRWPAPVERLLDEQVRAPFEEIGLRARLSRLTPIRDAASRALEARQDVEPHPRWSALPRVSAPLPLPEFLAARLPGSALPEGLPRGALRALSAGCGTGQQTIEIAQSLAGVDLLAVDVNRANLAYAQRRALASGVANLRFAHADVLTLGRTGLQFDLVDCSGVLDHLADPWQGLAALVGLLRPGGLLRLALHSESARRTVTAARAHLAARRAAPDLAGIRVCRAEIRSLPSSHPARGVLALEDFYSAGGCRELFFQGAEQRFALPALADALAAQRLRFLGFELPAGLRDAFVASGESPEALGELAAWDRFERRQPDAFARKYRFWARRER